MNIKEAAEKGQTRYQSETPCPLGHVGDRYVSNQACCICAASHGKRYRSEESDSERTERLEKRRQLQRAAAANKRAAAAPLLQAQEKLIKEMQAERGIDLPISRAEAMESGSVFYFNGKPCPKGHITIRRTKSPGCEECMPVVRRDSRVKRREERPEDLKAAKRRHYERRAEHIKSRVKAWAEENKESVLEKAKAYQKSNPHIFRINGSLRRARKNNATPPWVAGAVLQQIKNIYAEASKLTCSQGFRLAVDHIVPLRNSAVCGLHVPANLRLATKLENSKKNNRFDEQLGRECSIPLGCGYALGSYQLL